MISREGGHLALGLTIGVLVCVPSLLFLEVIKLPFAFNEAILGAIVGGAIAGLVSLGAQWLVILDGLRKSELDRLAVEKAQAQSIFIKLHTFVDRIHKWRNYYWTYESKHLVFINDEPRLWKPIFGGSEDLRLSIEEKALLLSTKESKLFNDISDLQRLSENLSMLHSRYSDKFFAFQEKARSQGDVEVLGTRIASEGPADVVGLMELEDLLRHLRRALSDGVPISRLALDRTLLFLVEEHSLKIDMVFEEDISGVVQA